MTSIINQFYKLLTNKDGLDLLPLAYGNNDTYNTLIQNCKDYYPFQDEVMTINSNQVKLSKYLAGVETLVEIGPGSEQAVRSKTLPIIKYISTLKAYYPIDVCLDYLVDTQNIFSIEVPEIKVYPMKANILSDQFNCHLPKNKSAKTAIMILGGTIGNFSDNELENIFKNIQLSMKKGDLLICTVDTNTRKEIILKAYDNSFNRDFFKSALKYFADIDENFTKNIDNFNITYDWNHTKLLVDIYFTTNKNLILKLPTFGNITMDKNKKYRGIKSRKFNIDNVIEKFNNQNLKIIDIIDFSNKMNIFLCEK